MLKLLHGEAAGAEHDVEPAGISLDELCRIAAQDMIAVALLAERRAYLEDHADVLDASGRRLVVGNGFARARTVTTGAGMVEVKAPRVDDRREGQRFASAILPAYMRKSPKVTEVLPVLYRESTDSWAELLRSLRDRGLSAPVLAVGDGALGFWGALRDVFPTTREQRCWVHRSVNVLDALPKRLHPDAKAALAKIYGAESRTSALEAVKTFAGEFSAFDKAVKKITGELDTLLAFYDFPAEHWVHLRTTNPIESTFSTVRLRTRVTRGAGSRKAAMAMAYKLLDAAQDRWRKIGGAELVPLVRAGATFIDGKLQERTEPSTIRKTTRPKKSGSVAA
jgi:hypothetical protein